MIACDRSRTHCLIAALAIAASCGRFRDVAVREPGREASLDHDGEREEPGDNDYLYLQRRLPDGRINLQAHSRALAHARLLRARLLATSGLDATGVWQLRGPINIGGRVTDLVGDPANASKFYVASASGGVWKTTDGGATFTPIFDGQGTLSIGALALDPRDSEHPLCRHRRGQPRRWQHHPARRRRVEDHRRRRDLAAPRPRQHRRDRPHRHRPQEPQQRVRRRDGQPVRAQRRSRRLPIAGRRRDLDQGAVRVRRRRRDRSRDRSGHAEPRVRRDLGAPAHPVGADLRRPGQRPVALDRRRHDLDRAGRRAAGLVDPAEPDRRGRRAVVAEHGLRDLLRQGRLLARRPVPLDRQRHDLDEADRHQPGLDHRRAGLLVRPDVRPSHQSRPTCGSTASASRTRPTAARASPRSAACTPISTPSGSRPPTPP